MLPEIGFHSHVIVEQLSVELVGYLQPIEHMFVVSQVVEKGLAQNCGIAVFLH